MQARSMKRLEIVLEALALGGLMAMAGCHSDMGVDPQELQRYKVMFARNATALNDPGGLERRICVANGDGSGLQDLSQHPPGGYPGAVRGWDSAPMYSHDGRMIAFQTNRDGNQDLYVMLADGSNRVNITRETELDLEFSWSPDGTRIAFSRLLQGKYVIHVVGSNGSGMNPITPPSESSRYPAWSPSGSQIAFSRRDSASGRWRVVLANADGSNVRIISDSAESAVFPQWSKDESRVFYNVIGAGLRVKNLDGSFSKSLPGFFPRTLSWTPDGRWFVTSDSMSIVMIPADLSSFSRLGIRGSEPSVSPDGAWILFLAQDVSSANEVHAARADGTDERTVASSQYGEVYPSWRPN
jgi:Tol biopolymer transport system component